MIFRPWPLLVFSARRSQAANMDAAGEVWAFARKQRRRRASGTFGRGPLLTGSGREELWFLLSVEDGSGQG